MARCRYCGGPARTSAHVRGTVKRWVPLCMAKACWDKFYKDNEAPKKKSRR